MSVVQHPALIASTAVDAGNARATRFETVFASHSGDVFAYARRRTTREEAEEVVSEAFLVAWRRFDELPPEPLPWLIGVARKVLANRRRADGRRAAADGRLRLLPDPARSSDPGESSPKAQHVREVLASLPIGEREVIELVAWEGLSPAEVATALGIARATVYVRLHRARQRLATQLREQR